MNEEILIHRDCEATAIPAGHVIVLPKGKKVFVKQALGGTVTVSDGKGLYRVDGANLAALGMETKGSTQDASTATRDSASDLEFSAERVWEILKECYDPEIPLNIVDLGLVYNLDLAEVGGGLYDVRVKMTLTAVGCGMGPSIASDARTKIEALRAVRNAAVDIVWDPQWNPHMISPKGRKVLGLD